MISKFKFTQNKLLLQLQRKYILEKFIRSPQNLMREEGPISKFSKTKSDEPLYEPEKFINFENFVYPIFKLDKGIRNKEMASNFLINLLEVYSLSRICFYLMIVNWKVVPFLIFYLVIKDKRLDLELRNEFLITSLNLMEDGKRVQVILPYDVKYVEISSMRNPTDEEMEYFNCLKKSERSYARAHDPLIIDGQIYLISEKATVFDKEMLDAVSSGRNVKIKYESVKLPEIFYE